MQIIVINLQNPYVLHELYYLILNFNTYNFILVYIAYQKQYHFILCI